MVRPEIERPVVDLGAGDPSGTVDDPPPVADPSRDEVTIGFDIGGSSIRAAIVDGGGVIHNVLVEPTPSDQDSLEDTLTAIVERLTDGADPVGVGLAVAGFLDRDRSRVRFAPHLPWIDRPVGEILSQRWGLPVVLEHDANSAGWAEYRFGAAAGSETAAVVAIGTGIGAALLVDGVLFRGAYGVAPELGHLQVVPNGRQCSCGKRGCLERYCSGTALVDTAIELAVEGRYTTALAEAVRDGGSAVAGRDVVSAAESGDQLGVDTMHRFGDWLAIGLAFVVDIFDPDRIVLCGGMAERSVRELGDVHARLRPLVTGGKHRPLPDVRLGSLGESAGLIGAADLVAARTAVPGR